MFRSSVSFKNLSPKNIMYFLFVGSISFFFVGCSSLSYFQTNVSNLPDNLIPACNQSVVIVNNAVEPSIDQNSYITFQNGQQKRFHFEHDSLLQTFTNELGNQFVSNHHLSDVLIYNVPQRKDTYGDIIQPLTSEQLQRIAQESACNWILSIDQFYCKTSLKEHTFEDYPFVEVSFEMIPMVSFKLYDSSNFSNTRKYFVGDTLLWKAIQTDFHRAVQDLPPFDACIIDGLDYIVDKAIKSWLPIDTPESRFYINHPNAAMREATNLRINNNMTDACYMWEYVYENVKSIHTRQCAAFNMAVYYESCKDYDKSLFWITKCMDLNTNSDYLYNCSLSQYKMELSKEKYFFENYTSFN